MTISGNGAEPEDGPHRLRLAVDQARREMGLGKAELAQLAGVSRWTVMNLINHTRVPGRPYTLERLDQALGWAPGSCQTVLEGGEPTVIESRQRGGPSSASKLVADRIGLVLVETRDAAANARALANQLETLAEQLCALEVLIERQQQNS